MKYPNFSTMIKTTLILSVLLFSDLSWASEFQRLRENFGEWSVRHVYNEETLHYRFSDAKTYITLGSDGKLPCQINRTYDGSFEFRFKYGFGIFGDWGKWSGWVTKVSFTIGRNKFDFNSEPGMLVHEFIAPVGHDFLQALANAKDWVDINIFVGDKLVAYGGIPSKGSSAALRWIRAIK